MPTITVDAVGDVQPRIQTFKVAGESIERFPALLALLDLCRVYYDLRKGYCFSFLSP
jgi:hypothetical protein